MPEALCRVWPWAFTSQEAMSRSEAMVTNVFTFQHAETATDSLSSVPLGTDNCLQSRYTKQKDDRINVRREQGNRGGDTL
ncbi:hypothetical protein AGIG_G16512 [Arapaima gigas]